MSNFDLRLGDCLEEMSKLEDGSVDLIFTSPPYNLGTTSGGGFPKGKTGKWGGGELADGYNSHSDAMPHVEYVEWQRTVLRECWRTLSDTGAIYYNHKPRVQKGALQTPLELVPEECIVRQVIIWKRNGGINFSPSFYLPTHEYVILIAKPAFRLRDKAASGAKDIWEVPQERGNPHPAPFPVALPMIALETTTGMRVMDPFMGSGTVGIACLKAGREFLGIEKDPGYFQMASDRIAQARASA